MNAECLEEYIGDKFNLTDYSGGSSAHIVIGTPLKDVGYAKKGEQVIIKSLKHENPNSFARLKREALILKKMKDSKYIINFHEFLEFADDSAAIVVEKAKADLQNWSKKKYKNNIPLELVDGIMKSINQGLNDLHSLKISNMPYQIVWRDPKANNVFVFEDDIIKLGDMGSAGLYTAGEKIDSEKLVYWGKELGVFGNTSRGTHGTEFFLAPELLQKQGTEQEHTISTDIYGVACIAWSLFTGGKTPFEYDFKIAGDLLSLIEAKKDFDFLKRMAKEHLAPKGIPSHKIDAILKGIHPDQKQRFFSTNDWIKNLHVSIQYDPLEQYYKKIQELLKEPLDKKFGTTRFSNIEYLIFNYEDMQSEKAKNKDLLDKAKNLLVERATKDEDKMSAYLDTLAEKFANQRNKKNLNEFKTYTKTVLTPVLKIMYAWGREFSPNFLQVGKQRVSPTREKKKFDKIVNQYISMIKE